MDFVESLRADMARGSGRLVMPEFGGYSGLSFDI